MEWKHVAVIGGLVVVGANTDAGRNVLPEDLVLISQALYEAVGLTGQSLAASRRLNNAENVEISVSAAETGEINPAGKEGVYDLTSYGTLDEGGKNGAPITYNLALFTAQLTDSSISSLDEAQKKENGTIYGSYTIPAGGNFNFTQYFNQLGNGSMYASGTLVSGGVAPGVGACQFATAMLTEAKKSNLQVGGTTPHPEMAAFTDGDESPISIFSSDSAQNLVLTNGNSEPWRVDAEFDPAANTISFSSGFVEENS